MSSVVFPNLDGEWVDNTTAVAERRRWVREVTEASYEWVSGEGDIIQWMSAYGRLRAELWTLVWRKMIPETLRSSTTCVFMGSAGRGESLLYSDLDHAVIYREGLDPEELTPHLYDVIRELQAFGWPICQGFVMSINPRWIGTAKQWSDRMDGYFDFPDWDNARYLFMLTDASTMDADVEWDALMERLEVGIRDSRFLLWEIAHLGIYRTVALTAFGRFRRLEGQSREVLHVKEGLLNPIVRSLQLLGVESGFRTDPRKMAADRASDMVTLARCRYLGECGLLTGQWVERIEKALLYGWRLRFRGQALDLLADREVSDYVTVPARERAELREHLLTAKHLERLTHQRFRKPRSER